MFVIGCFILAQKSPEIICWPSLQGSPRTSSWIKGPTSKGRGGEGKEGKKEKGWEETAREGKG